MSTDSVGIYVSNNWDVNEVTINISRETLRGLWGDATAADGYCVVGCGNRVGEGHEICKSCFLDELSGYKQELWQDIAEAVEGD